MAPLEFFSAHISNLFKRSSFPESPMESFSRLSARDDKDTKYNPGSGVISPTSFNNNIFFVLFALIGAGLVIASIWFFFWAPNGSFRFRKGDWEDYKTTVLRRRGPNGTLLSGATKSTILGGGSVVGSQGSMSQFADEEKALPTEKPAKKNRFRKSKNKQDDDVRAYREERPARVGGLNREPDGSYHDFTNSEMSEVSGARPTIQRIPNSNKNKTPGSTRTPAGRKFSYGVGTEATFSVASDDSHRPLTSSPQHQQRYSNNSTPNGTPRHSKQTAPAQKRASNRYSARSSAGPGSYAEPLDFDSRYDGSEAGTEQTKNTKAYHHPIPGLGKAGASGGFRRGGGGRRDSLSDSDGETRRS